MLNILIAAVLSREIILDTQLRIPVFESQPIIWPSSEIGQAILFSDDLFIQNVKQSMFTKYSTLLRNITASISGYCAGQLHFTELSGTFYPLTNDYSVNIDDLKNLKGERLDYRANILLNELFYRGFIAKNLSFNSLNSTRLEPMLLVNDELFVGDANLGQSRLNIDGPVYVLASHIKDNKLLINVTGIEDISMTGDGGMKIVVNGYGKIGAIFNIKSITGGITFQGNPRFNGARSLLETIEKKSTSPFKIAGIVSACMIFAAIIVTFGMIVRRYIRH